ncbi:CPBP family intramembrane glutamic endopeptidase [Halohasta litorea]|uniref:CPBP family intramembrane glutamic endopeptidase n=1 Tax=Halohasta litorea TaxID=869891 RepID=A0ABD6DBX4_9EURY|nr:CPBP family intramembrane glutamic endopeptidase [Halohasta litorea]
MSDAASTLTEGVPEKYINRTSIVRTALVLTGVILVTVAAHISATLAVVSMVGSDTSDTLTFAAVTVGSELAFLLVGSIYLHFRSSFRLPVGLPIRQVYPILFVGLIGSFVTAFLSLAITDSIVPILEFSPGYMEYSGLGEVAGSGLVVGAVLSISVIGPVEEFFFRGVIQGRLREALGPIAAISIAGAVFALFHVYPVALLSPPPAVITHMSVYYTLMGAIFGWVYHRTDTLVAPAFVHGLFNGVVFSIPLWI